MMSMADNKRIIWRERQVAKSSMTACFAGLIYVTIRLGFLCPCDISFTEGRFVTYVMEFF